MWRRSPAARAVFHDRMAMEEAVRALELEGVNRRHISVSRADASGGGVRRSPETGSALSIAGAVGSAIGAALALSSFDWTGRGLPLSVVAVRVLVGAATGALLGALLVLVTRGIRHESRYQHPAGYPDYLVKVKTPDRVTAERVRDLLGRAGGELLPS